MQSWLSLLVDDVVALSTQRPRCLDSRCTSASNVRRAMLSAIMIHANELWVQRWHLKHPVKMREPLLSFGDGPLNTTLAEYGSCALLEAAEPICRPVVSPTSKLTETRLGKSSVK